MILLDRFFDGTFFTYGIEVMSFADRDQEDRIDPMIYVFPRFLSIHDLIRMLKFASNRMTITRLKSMINRAVECH